MKNSLLVFGTKNFINSLKEIKEYLDFSLKFFHNDIIFSDAVSSVNALLIDSDVCNDGKYINLINSVNKKPILLVSKPGVLKKCNYTHRITSPLLLSDFNTWIVSSLTSEEFNKNSSVTIKEYTLDKNEKKLKKNKKFIVITEQEIKLIELLFYSKDSVTKKKILESAWQYSSNTDTHTIETHIYRLRNKILKKFNDENFIINTNKGYKI